MPFPTSPRASTGGGQAETLQELKDCTLVPTTWADSDSFRIRTATGEEHTIRLYGVDCIELHAHTESMKRRLREQRRHFGITTAGGNSRNSIAIARKFAAQAKARTASLLTKPFTVHTDYQDAMGDKRFKRIYAYVTCADGRDLASELVRAGLARAYGYDSDHPNGNSAHQMEALYRDIELVAAKQNTGVWAHTDWMNCSLSAKPNAAKPWATMRPGRIDRPDQDTPVTQGFEETPRGVSVEQNAITFSGKPIPGSKSASNCRAS